MQTNSVSSNTTEEASKHLPASGIPNYLGKYRVESVLGEGGMGVVYKGYDADIARTVAIKTVRRSLLEGQAGQELLKRFRREVRAEGRMLHNNIVTVYEFGLDEQSAPFFVMEYIEGRSLKEYLTMGTKFELDKAISIIKQVLAALDYSHKLGVIHRDIKPANIMLLENNTVKLADFGIALVDDTESTQTGLLMGTPQYMSPEQCAGGMIDSRSDLYSVGLVLYELITGVKAFSNIGPENISRKLRGQLPTKPNVTQPETLKLFEKVILKSLAKLPNDRFQTAQDFLESIENISEKPSSSFSNGPSWKKKFAWILGGNLVGIIIVIALSLYFYPSKPDHLMLNTARQKTMDTTGNQPLANLSEAQKNKINRLFKIANSHLLVGRLVAPSGSNAYYTYGLILKTDPGNTKAQEGIANVQNHLLTRSRKLMSNGELQQVAMQLEVALMLFPNHPGFRQLQNEIDAAW